jgi:hypothetical protein
MEERFLMKWFRNPFKPPVWYGIQKKWWSLAAPQLMRELKQLGDISKKDWDEYERLNDRIEELEDKNAELNRKNMLNQNGYWHVVNDGNNHSCYRLDEKFIEWYKMWREPIQMKLEFEYERCTIKEEEKRYDPIYGGLIE